MESRHQEPLSPGVDAHTRQSYLVPLVRERAIVQVAKETPAMSVDVGGYQKIPYDSKNNKTVNMLSIPEAPVSAEPKAESVNRITHQL